MHSLLKSASGRPKRVRAGRGREKTLVSSEYGRGGDSKGGEGKGGEEKARGSRAKRAGRDRAERGGA